MVAQVPGGMLTNMENQLREQGAGERMDDVLAEIPRVREDLGFIPLVTPTSQIVGTQAVINVLSGERYKSMSKETRGVLRGEYGAAPAPFNKVLQERALEGDEPVTCRPADLLEDEFEHLGEELNKLAGEEGIRLEQGERLQDDVLTYALFTQIGLKFLKNRDKPDAFEPIPTGKESSVPTSDAGEEIYTVDIDGKRFTVSVSEGGDITGIKALAGTGQTAALAAPGGGGEPVSAPLAGNIFKILVKPGQQVQEGEKIMVLEAMKMETDVSAPRAGTIGDIRVREGDSVSAGDPLVTLA